MPTSSRKWPTPQQQRQLARRRRRSLAVQAQPLLQLCENYIDAQRYGSANNNQTATTGYVLQYVNQNAQLYGVDVSGKLQLAKTTAYGSFDATAQLSYTRGENLTPATTCTTSCRSTPNWRW
jgi:hypothetical protein